LKSIIILGIIALVFIPAGIWIFAGVFFVLIFYTFRKQIQTKIYKQNEYDGTTLEEMR